MDQGLGSGPDSCGHVLQDVVVFVSQLREYQTADSKDAECIPPGIVANLDAVPVDIAQRLSETHPEKTPTIPLTRLATQPVVATFAEDVVK